MRNCQGDHLDNMYVTTNETITAIQNLHSVHRQHRTRELATTQWFNEINLWVIQIVKLKSYFSVLIDMIHDAYDYY